MLLLLFFYSPLCFSSISVVLLVMCCIDSVAETVKLFALQTSVFIIKIIHFNMLRHASLQYQEAKRAVLYS
ncbi:hypothetical protein H4Q32_010472 [Labeo rohita]|uniref:Secreted protein n=1 Tax=Labeo rohita TaxID=84645 RepID=A0ABQ8MUR9_LABRO|nr:hypothetical protein H4Q32_010472 [Labeo rohita]